MATLNIGQVSAKATGRPGKRGPATAIAQVAVAATGVKTEDKKESQDKK